MQFCNFCAKNNAQVKQIHDNKVSSDKNVINITTLLNIFHNEVVKFLLDNKEALICCNCLKQLRNCYEFVQQIMESQNKLIQGQEIQTEHDYFEATENCCVTETVNKNVTVNDERPNKQVKLETINSDLKFKTILPKPESVQTTKTTNKNPKPDINIKTRLYKCLQCTESFKSFKNLKQHEQEFCENNFTKDVQCCKYCHKCFCSEHNLNNHIALNHIHGEFRCCLCEDKTFAGKGYLARHLEKNHQQQSLTYFCGECLETVHIATQDDLRTHFKQKHSSTNVGTSVEEQTSTILNDDDMDLEMHEEFLDEFLLAHTNENSFQFSECWEALDLHLPDMLQASSSNLNEVAEFSEAFSCPKCFEQFKNPQPLLKHLAEKHDLPVLMCRSCQKCFASYKEFKKHKLQKCIKTATLLPLTLQCPYCNKSFKNCSNLKQHLRIVHCQLKRHTCELCDNQFSTLDHLKKHVLSRHQNERKHLCTVCDKSFTQLGHLKQHLAIHTTGKTYKCVECSLKFWRKIDMERHRRKRHISGGK